MLANKDIMNARTIHMSIWAENWKWVTSLLPPPVEVETACPGTARPFP